MRGIPFPRAFLADAVPAVNDRRLAGPQHELEGEIISHRPQMLLTIAPLRLPIAVPHLLRLQTRTSDSRSGSVQPLCVIEPLAIDVAQRKMRQIDVVNIPVASSFRIAIHALPEERQLKTKAMPIGGFQIPGVIPPLGFVFGMREVIAREFVAVARQRLLVLRRERSGDHEQQQGHKPTPHAPPRWDSAGPQCVRDRTPPGPWLNTPG